MSAFMIPHLHGLSQVWGLTGCYILVYMGSGVPVLILSTRLLRGHQKAEILVEVTP